MLWKTIVANDDGIRVNIAGVLNAREAWDLLRELTDAIHKYHSKIGHEKFGEEMRFNPEAGADVQEPAMQDVDQLP